MGLADLYTHRGTAIVRMTDEPQGIATAQRGILDLIHGWAPFVGLLAAYEVMRGAAAPLGRVVGILLWSWAIVVWVAVVYLGEHYVTDVMGGVAYAGAAIVLVKAVIPQRRAVLAEPPGASSNVPSRFHSAGARRSQS